LQNLQWHHSHQFSKSLEVWAGMDSLQHEVHNETGTPTSLNRSNATLPSMSQATKIITAVPPEWSKTWDGQPWNSVAETAA